MVDPSVGLETAILTVLSQSNRPLKARAIAVLISVERPTALHKRDINPILYRMLANGDLSRDTEFRWTLCRQSLAIAVPVHESESLHTVKQLDSTNKITCMRPELVEQHPARGNLEKNLIVELPETKIANAEEMLESITHPSPENRVFGNLHVKREMRPWERHCTWCFERIPERQMALLVDGARHGRPRFCSDDCFQNWESLYWQRLAISHLGLTSEERRREQKDLRLQRRFSRFR